MSNYYDYREVKVMIAHKLMAMDGWTVYGYSPDTSDAMTDYYNPAHWDGVAEKNGYILCVDVYGEAKPYEVKRRIGKTFVADKNISDKISKLEKMTVENGASPAEEESAKKSIERLQQKSEENNENQFVVVDVIPGHMAHPPKCNWHIEKDGLIIAKGNGILKYSDVYEYFSYSHYEKSMKEFRTQTKEKYVSDLAAGYVGKGYYLEENAIIHAENQYIEMQKTAKLIDDFNKFINKLDTTCGCLVGEGDLETYEKIIVTEYKTETKAIETETGSIKEGQCFILKSGFTHGCRKGLVYRIHRTEYNGKEYFHAYKLNGKLTKECTGNASSNNQWSTFNEKFLKWIETGAIAWCELEEVKTPYEVEKVVKKTIKSEKKENAEAEKTETTSNAEMTDISNYTFTVTEDTDTRNGEKIFLVKIEEKLSREEYLQLNKFIKGLGGYYSKFKHAFLFKENPSELLKVEQNTEQPETKNETKEEEQKENVFEYEISEDTHTKTNEKLWLVSVKDELSKTQFAEVKRKFATMQGYYSSFKHAFIFKYDPTEKLSTA